MIVKCNYCQKLFKTFLSRIKNSGGKYCSKDCYYKSERRTKISIICQFCKKEFYVYPIRKESAKFCSRQCYYNFKKKPKNNYQWKKRVNMVCKQCKKVFSVRLSPSQIERKKFCSKTCLSIYTIAHKMPKKNTLIERIVKKFLKEIKLTFTQNIAVENIAVVDFLLPNNNIIQCDGDYWHSIKKVKDRDKRQDNILKNRGYNVLRLTESQIKSQSYNWKTKIQRLEVTNGK